MFAAIAWILISKRPDADALSNDSDGFRVLDRHALPGGVVVTTFRVPSLHYSTRAWIAVAEQGLLATASTTLLWNWGLKRVPASQAGIFVNFEPLVGAILGVSILHEVLGRIALAGCAHHRSSPLFQLQAAKECRIVSHSAYHSECGDQRAHERHWVSFHW